MILVYDPNMYHNVNTKRKKYEYVNHFVNVVTVLVTEYWQDPRNGIIVVKRYALRDLSLTRLCERRRLAKSRTTLYEKVAYLFTASTYIACLQFIAKGMCKIEREI